MSIRRGIVLAAIAGSLTMSCATTTPGPTPTPSPTPSPAPSPSPTPSVAPPVVEGPCEPWAAMGVLPEWAREGFSDPEPTAVHAVGRGGEIAAILFGGSLYAPPDDVTANKILWVSKDAVSLGQLVISAQRMEGSTPVGDPVERIVDGGPGPSTIDLPEAGCWRMTLTWADRTDSLDLAYQPPTAFVRRLAAT